jgi:hypothetical protein
MSNFQESKTVENSKRKRESDIFEEVPKRYKKFHEYVVQNDLILDEEKFCKSFKNSVSVESNENEKKALEYINQIDENFNIQDLEKELKIENDKNYIIASLQLISLDDD